MESRVESHALRSSTGISKPNMFQAGLSNKFTKRHITNFHDTTLTAASAAKARAELKMERQANAIEKQQQKIEHEMKKIEAITEKLQRQQAREAKRLRNRLMYAASRIQLAYRAHLTWSRSKRNAAAVEVQRHWRGCRGRKLARELAAEQEYACEDDAARVITRNVRVFACRLALRDEVEWRNYAATILQSVVRRYQATNQLNTFRREREAVIRCQRAATIIQSHARGFLTRLVYMDVLYLVCRIQSVARGFLVRKRLRFLLSLNLRAIVRLQALARGFLVRQRTNSLLHGRRIQTNDAAPDEEKAQSGRVRRVPKPRLTFVKDRSLTETTPQLKSVRQAHKSPSRQATFALATMASMVSPAAPSPPRIKRSYWLPSGANNATQPRVTRHRLPKLSVARPVPSLHATSPSVANAEAHAFDEVAAHVVNMQRIVRGRLLAKRPPQRLAPLERASGGDNRNANHLVEAPDEDAQKRTAEVRREREELLKRKLMARKIQERKRLEQEQSLRQQLEREELERKLMEREEKLTRLWAKTTQRKHHQLKMRRMTLEQQREEKERMEMLREERLVRLHLRRLSRVANEAGAQRRRSRQELELDSSGSDSESDNSPVMARKNQLRDEDTRVVSCQKNLQPQRTKNTICFAPVPAPIKPSKSRTKPSDIAKKKTRELRAVYGGAGASNQTSTRDEEGSRSRELQEQYASWNFHSDEFVMQGDLVEDDAEFDYGNEFEEVVEETNLTRLIC